MSVKEVQKSNGNEPESPWSLVTDGEGNTWRKDSVGRMLKVGGNHARPGRPPKQAIRDSYLNNAELAVTRDRKILASDLPDDHPAVERAKERGARYGLGLKDEVQLQDREAVLRAFAALSIEEQWGDAESARLLARFVEKLGIE